MNDQVISPVAAPAPVKRARKPAEKPFIRATLGNANPKKCAQQENIPRGDCYVFVARGQNGELVEAITVRTYWNPRGSGMQPVRASVWCVPFERSDEWRNGRGAAAGCGYDKSSTAIAEAFDNAGIEFWGSAYKYRHYGEEKLSFKKRVHFGGTGDTAYPEIFKAAAKALGYKGKMKLVRW